MTAETLVPEKCTDPLIHEAHEWGSHEPASDDPGEDGWVPVQRWCEGNADQDDPLDRYECCAHCAAKDCPRRDGHPDPCSTPGCQPGKVMLGEPQPVEVLADGFPAPDDPDCARMIRDLLNGGYQQ